MAENSAGKEKGHSSSGLSSEGLRGRDLNPRPLGYAYHFSFRCLNNQFVVWTFPSSSAELLGCLPSSLYTFSQELLRAWLGITIARGFPEFER
jgi:hypothetical protein